MFFVDLGFAMRSPLFITFSVLRSFVPSFLAWSHVQLAFWEVYMCGLKVSVFTGADMTRFGVAV
jgi:hypothetical protein